MLFTRKRRLEIQHGSLIEIKLNGRNAIPLSISLTQRNLEKGHDFLMDVSDPTTPNHEQHWTPSYNNSQSARGFPDISANGSYHACVLAGERYSCFGTSVATQIIGSIITLINEQRVHAGKGPVGFINPVLYTNPWALNDIKVGIKGVERVVLDLLLGGIRLRG